MGLKSAPGLAIGSNKARVANSAFSYKIIGTVYDKGAVSVGTDVGDDIVPAGKYGAIALEIGTDGTIDLVEASDNAVGYTTALLAINDIPVVSEAHVRLGTVTAIKTDTAFTFGTTELDADNSTVVYTDGNVNYPDDDAGLSLGTIETLVSVENWNGFVDNLNELISDLILANGDGAVFPGTDHTADQSICMDDAMQSIRHQLVHVLGESKWYDAPAGSLKVHTHAVGQGGLVAWSSLGASAARKVELHPQYPGALLTKSLRGTSASGNNTITITNDVDVVSYVGRHYYDGVSSQSSLQDYYVALRFTLPVDFGTWAASNAIQIEHRTGSALSSDCHVDAYIYKSGSGSVVASSENNVNVNWSTISISDSALGTWAAGDILEMYIKLESRNSNYAKIGKIVLSYNA
jgi:hypothetical protein